MSVREEREANDCSKIQIPCLVLSFCFYSADFRQELGTVKFLRKFAVIWIWEALGFTHGKACGCLQFLLTAVPHSVIVCSVHKGTTSFNVQLRMDFII